jgi:anti-sigma factor RsiW
MNCRQSRGLFSAYWDDELTQAEREWLEAHFATCPSCRREYDEMTRAVELVGALPRVEVETGFAEKVLATARRKAPAQDRIPITTSRWIPLTAVAALVAVMGGTALQWIGLPKVQRSGAPSVEEQVVLQPVRIAEEGTAGREPNARAEAEPEPLAAMGDIPDSLFDHSEDVEFILDGVTLRKGRAHTVPLGPDAVRGAAAVITF